MEKEKKSRKRKGDLKEPKGKNKKARKSVIQEEPIEEELPTQELRSSPIQDAPQNSSIASNPDSYNTFWLHDVAKREDGDNLLKLKLTEQDFRDNLPVYIDKGGCINSNLGPFFSNSKLENRVLSIFGIPGLGKTSTIQAFAIRYKCKYIRFISTRGLTGSMMVKMDTICKSAPLSVKQLMLKLDYISMKTIQTILQHVAAEATRENRLFISEHLKNGLDIADNVLESNDELMDAVSKISKEVVSDQSLVDSGIVVVHFDECQHWISSHQARKKDDELVLTREEAMMYRLISFSQCLECVPGNIRFAFTGTHIKVDSLLRFESSMRLYPTSTESVITIATAEDIKHLLSLFVDITKINDSLIQKLVGPYRIVQFFLQHLYSGKSPEGAKELAYDYWQNMAKQPFKDMLPIADPLLLFYFAGSALNATKNNDGSITISKDLIDVNWLSWAQHSLIIMNETQDDAYIITPPFPFLLRLLFKKAVLLDFKHMEELMCQFRAHWVDASKGRGYIFQWALPIELKLPHSPLVLKVVQSLQKCFNSKNIKFPQFKTKIGYFEKDDEAVQNAKEEFISVSFDANRANVKIGDLSMQVLVDDKPKHVRCEAKLYGFDELSKTTTSQCRTECSKFFKKVENNGDIDVAIFFCWMDMDLNGKSGKLLQEVDEYIDKLNGSKRYVVIDNMKDLKFILDMRQLCSPKRGDDLATFCKKLMHTRDSFSKDLVGQVHEKIMSPEKLALGMIVNISAEYLTEAERGKLAIKIATDEELITTLIELQHSDIEKIINYCKSYLV